MKTYDQYKLRKKKIELEVIQMNPKNKFQKIEDLSLHESVKLLLPPLKYIEASSLLKTEKPFESNFLTSIKPSQQKITRFLLQQCFYVQIKVENLRQTPFINKLDHIQAA